ncbi:2-succinyl-5-enolpyruvyl-6-hydroxy-3-cyclohexene-1-carboxylic-acid synthase [Solirubrobacter sp. CPCC 204708]|uniref:2-succinyl-5-enolpyruvyl-6-hydroxy-3-cyclohexene-1-carboxylate synthase n=1 Tax=Solirubrobacter deserti TaxID=2282478 RepID=A0ABT4RN21_9ACTN|nr:2-succinyl-5-enolpyruvyl-6-hydroxy-3-cyclohexene-1-carboxylic-acid synthase [Solirubrobacter deserti]MBE2315029.1 2-succinyl-5-enolpyruvyl-6-hydroxy-3-cyclohexene-1-carboxylic-acid synthase [Solirubrobacter deserti]MDA0139944.1 2-succinyl-5-enolpyruvyl-6-hydroxy-3-cyclohexene-1-carboxylic-acid synthase [Solirubrobacter deserti]
MPGTDTYLCLRAFVDELVRCGLRDACTSPGSRSTPLTLSFAWDGRLRSTSHLDERSGAFFALGLAKTTGVPPALVCTSGTAAANYAPAVHEAYEARVPLLVLTADRPPELRAIGAGQTIDQIGLYGSAAKWFFEVDDFPASPARVRWLRQLACRAFWTALDGRPGPVHLNFSFREPLVPDGSSGVPATEVVEGRAGGRPWVARPPVPRVASDDVIGALTQQVREASRAVVVAGRSERDPRLGASLAAFCEKAGLPLLADPLSGARRGPAAIAHYDALLRSEAFGSSVVPDLVLRVGDLPTSKPLRAWLASSGALQVSFDAETAWQDPDGSVGTIVAANPRVTFDELTARVRKRRDRSWFERWHAADRAAAGAIAGALGSALNEPRVSAELGSRLPDEAVLVVASSMPVRDVETFFPARPNAFRVLSNRGANGIDGTVSTAFGVAAASSGPVVLLIGDVALAHDVGGLLAASRLGLRLVIVLIDNDGGGIFEFLPASGQGAAYVDHIATPHGLDFAHAAALYGLGWEPVADVESFRSALDRALVADRSTIISVRTDRSENVDLHRRVWESVRSST